MAGQDPCREADQQAERRGERGYQHGLPQRRLVGYGGDGRKREDVEQRTRRADPPPGDDQRTGAGHEGGRVVFEGTPAELVAARATLTGEHLAAYVST